MIIQQQSAKAIACLALLITCVCAHAQRQAPSNYILERLAPWDASDTVPTRVEGEHYFIRWSNISKSNSSKFAHSKSTLLPRPIGFPVPLPGELYEMEPIFPGYRATEGFYALTGDFGLVARIEPTRMIGPDYAIKSLVFQTSSMLNWPAGWTLEDYFHYNHADHFSEDSAATGDMADYDASPQLLALSDILLDNGEFYRGGPVLKYTTTEGLTGYRHADSYALLNNGVRMTDLGETGQWGGTYYSFCWHWDLSDIPGTIANAEVTCPLIVHSSTIGTQIDVSDTYNDILSTFPPPPPSRIVATPGDSAVLLTWQARSGATGYEIMRSTTKGGPYNLIGSVSGGANTSYNDLNLDNGTTYYYVITAVNDNGPGAESVERSIVPEIPAIHGWRLNHFGHSNNTGDAANNADPDGDGLTNLVEYALRCDPLVADSKDAITVGQTDTSTKRLALTFNRRADPALVYIVDATDDIDNGTWDRVFLSTGLANPDNFGYAYGTSGVNSIIGNDDDTYQAWDNIIVGSRKHRYLRLSILTAGN